MSRVLEVEFLAKKGAAHRKLRQEATQLLCRVDRTEPGVSEMIAVFEAAVNAAKKLIPAAGRGDQVEVLVRVEDTPLGGWQSSVKVDVPCPTYPAR